jgi:hypothetical protein
MGRAEATRFWLFIVQFAIHSTLALAQSLVPDANLGAHKRRLMLSLRSSSRSSLFELIMTFKLFQSLLKYALRIGISVADLILCQSGRRQGLAAHTGIMSLPSARSLATLNGDKDDAGNDNEGENNRRCDDQRRPVERGPWVRNTPSAR